MNMFDTFIKRAKSRRNTAYLFLFLAVAIIVLASWLFYESLKQSAKYADFKEMVEKVGALSATLTVVFKLTFLILLLFLSQIFLKLYKYNFLKSDFFLACADALILGESFKEVEKLNHFTKLLPLLTSEKISLETPDSPSIQVPTTKV